MASGETIYQIQQTGGCYETRRVDLAVYVNPDRCPQRPKKEHKKKCDKCKKEEAEDGDDD